MHQPICLPTDAASRDLSARYERLALVSTDQHVARLGSTGAKTLIGVCDWLLWQKLQPASRHTIYVPAYRSPVGQSADCASDLFLKMNNWIYVEDMDVTRFLGVSLGRKAIARLSGFAMEHDDLVRSLDVMCAAFRPRQCLYFDYRMDRCNLDTEDRWNLARDVMSKHGVELIDHRESQSTSRPSHLGPKLYILGRGTDRLRQRFVRAMIRCAEIAARARLIGRMERPRILVAATAMTTVPLLSSMTVGSRALAMVLGRWLPNKRNFPLVAARILNGVLPVDTPVVSLSQGEESQLEHIKSTLLGRWKTSEHSDLHHLVQKYIFSSGYLKFLALDVKWAERLFKTHRPDCIVTDGLQNPVTTALLEIASQHGVATAAIWHSPHYHDVKLDIFGCDARASTTAKLVFSWGQANDDWLSRTGARSEVRRTGSVAASAYSTISMSDRSRGQALVLQYNITINDKANHSSQEYYAFVEVIRLLSRSGISKIRIRLHPGERAKESYYRQIIEYFDLRCEISVGNTYYEDLEWASFVIGPAASGAMVEALAARRPYYPVLLPPHSVNMTHLKGAVYEDLASLEEDLKRGDPPPEQERLREAFTSLNEIPDPAKRAWDILVEMATKSAAIRASGASVLQ